MNDREGEGNVMKICQSSAWKHLHNNNEQIICYKTGLAPEIKQYNCLELFPHPVERRNLGGMISEASHRLFVTIYISSSLIDDAEITVLIFLINVYNQHLE